MIWTNPREAAEVTRCKAHERDQDEEAIAAPKRALLWKREHCESLKDRSHSGRRTTRAGQTALTLMQTLEPEYA